MCYTFFPLICTMKFEKKHAGKWVAVKGGRVVASSSSLRALQKKTSGGSVRFTLVPKGFIAGNAV